MTASSSQQATTRRSGERNGIASVLVLAVASLIGLAAFFGPLLITTGRRLVPEGESNATWAPLLFVAVSICCLGAILVSLSDDASGVARAKTVALLGVLVALDATLRLVPSVLGASPIFLLIMLVGAVFGSSIGFQMGALTLLLSGVVTGGIGPWLPFQMLASGWVGMTAGWLPRRGGQRVRIAALAAFGAIWGLAFGMQMNIRFWPLTAPGVGVDTGLYWSPDLTTGEAVARYARFYAVTSLGFDLFRAIGNVVLVLVLGGPVLRLLERYRERFSWQPWVPLERPSDE